jgi:hypothetical protein
MADLIQNPMFGFGFLPGEKEIRTSGQQVLNLLGAVDPAQGIMRAMSASGRAFDRDLPVEDRKRAGIEAGIETLSPLLTMGAGSLLRQPAKAVLMETLLPAGSVDSVARQPVDISVLRSYDSPDVIRHMFLDDEYAADVLGSVKNADPDVIPDAASMSDVTAVRGEIYAQTQDLLKDLPDEVTVYRAGGLNERDGVSSFTLDPDYNANLNLPWNDLRGSPELETYKVRKSDILASPNILRDFGESEIIIRNDSVTKTSDVKRFSNGGYSSVDEDVFDWKTLYPNGST